MSIATIFLGLISIFMLYLAYRNTKTCTIRLKILDYPDIETAVALYEKLPSYERMMFSFSKPLTYKYWLKYAEDKLNNK